MYFLKFYQLFVSPFLHVLCGPSFGCRFEPTCSRYTEQAIQEYGWFKGLILGMKSILRCHPFSKSVTRH